jgi:hypothetical protein
MDIILAETADERRKSYPKITLRSLYMIERGPEDKLLESLQNPISAQYFGPISRVEKSIRQQVRHDARELRGGSWLWI